MNSVFLVVDRLHWGYLGAYGNTWVRTPAFDRLAAEGFVYDGAFIESPNLELFCNACWAGRHAMGPVGSIDAEHSLGRVLAKHGVSTRLLTDEPLVARHTLAGTFDEVIQVDHPLPRTPAESLEKTLLASYFAQVLELLESASEPFLLWCHTRSLAAVWDAPRELRQAVWEEGDPEPPDFVLPPEIMLPKHYDPDVLLGFSQVYAAQITVLDVCLDVVLDWLSSSRKGRETMLAVVSARGFPLGEHFRVGACDEALYPESVHIPLMIRLPSRSADGDRSDALVQPSDLPRTICDGHGVARDSLFGGMSLLRLMDEGHDAARQCIGIVGNGTERAFVSPAWYLRRHERCELFLRPDDCWCANDVADRCPEIVEAMSSTLLQYNQAMQSEGREPMLALDPRLLAGID